MRRLVLALLVAGLAATTPTLILPPRPPGLPAWRRRGSYPAA